MRFRGDKSNPNKNPRDEKTSWDRLPLSKTKKQVLIQFRVSLEMRDRMKIAGDWLKKQSTEKNKTGFKRNFPSRFCKYCTELSLDGLEELMNNEKANEKH